MVSLSGVVHLDKLPMTQRHCLLILGCMLPSRVDSILVCKVWEGASELGSVHMDTRCYGVCVHGVLIGLVRVLGGSLIQGALFLGGSPLIKLSNFLLIEEAFLLGQLRSRVLPRHILNIL